MIIFSFNFRLNDTTGANFVDIDVLGEEPQAKAAKPLNAFDVLTKALKHSMTTCLKVFHSDLASHGSCSMS